MKKLLCAVLALFILSAMLFGIVGCDNGSDKDEEDTEQTEEEDVETYPIEEVTMNKQVLVNIPGVKVILNGIVTSGEWGARLRLAIINDTEDTLVFQTHETAVNGFMIDSIMSVEVKPDKEAYTSLSFSVPQLETSKITSVANVEFYISIHEKDTWDLKHESEKFHLKTSIADTYDDAYDFSGTTLYEDESLTVKAQELTEGDDAFSAGVVICADNRGEAPVAMQIYDVTLNGDSITPIFYNEVLPGKMAADKINILKSDFNRLNIVDVVELSFSLHIFDPEGWEESVDVKDITLHFEPRGDVLYNENGVIITSQGLSEDIGYGEGLILLVRNSSDKELTVAMREISVNGIKTDEEFSFDANAADSARGTFIFDGEFIEENDIKKIDKVEFSLQMFESDGEGDIVDIGSVTLDFE